MNTTLKTPQLFCKAYGLSSIGVNMINAVFILLLSQIKGYNTMQIAVIVSIAPLVIFPVIFLWGKFIDKYKNLIWIIKFMIIAQGLLSFTLLWIDQFPLFFIVNLLRLLLTQPWGAIHDEYMFNLSSKYALPFSKIRIFGTLGCGIAGIITPFVVKISRVETAILVGIIVIVTSLLFYKFLPNQLVEDTDQITKKEPMEKSAPSFNFELFKNPGYVKFLMVSILLFGSQSAASGFGNQIVLINLGCPPEFIASLPFVLIIFEALFLAVLHRFRIFSKSYYLFFIALLAACLRWVVVSTTSNYIMVLLVSALHGVIFGLTLPAQTSVIIKLVPHKDRSTALLLQNSLAYIVAPSLINLFTSSLVEKVGLNIFGNTYLCLSIIAIILIIPELIQQKRAYSYH